MSWLSRLFKGNQPGPSAASQAFTTQGRRVGGIAERADAQYEADNASFDPRAAFKEYATGANEDFRRTLGTELRGLRDSAAPGRMDTGFYDVDRGEIGKDLASRFSADLNRRALDTAGMRQRQIEYTGNYGMSRGQDYQDMLAGTLDRETAERNAKRKFKGDLIGGAMQLGGAALGAR